MSMEELRSLLTVAVTENEPPVGGGPGAVFARAHRRRRRHRIALASCFAGVLTAVVAAGAVLPVRSAPPDLMDAQPLTAQLTPGAVVSDSPLLTLIRSVLPAGLEVSDATETAPDEFPWTRGQLVLTDTNGRTTLSYVVITEGDLTPYLQCGRIEASCDISGESLKQVRRQYRYPGDRIATCVHAQKSAHLVVGVCAMNAFPVRGSAPGPVTRATPVLSVDQLVTIVSDPRWTRR